MLYFSAIIFTMRTEWNGRSLLRFKAGLIQRVPMECHHIEFEHQLILIIGNQKIKITPSVTPEIGTIKFGIDAPFGLSVNREEIYKRKQESQQLDPHGSSLNNYVTKIPALFTELLTITHKSEKLELAAKNLFDKTKILTPKTLDKIACGEMSTSKWIVTCAIDILIQEKPKPIKALFSADELFFLWARPLLNRATESTPILDKAHRVAIPVLIDKIINYSKWG